jgi:hypothetical protein
MRRLWLVVAGCAIACGVAAAAPQPTIDTAFEKFWSARSPQEAAKAAQLVVASASGGQTWFEAGGDGNRFLLACAAGRATSPIVVSVDWTASLK